MSPTDGEVLRVVVADDHPVYREGLTMVLGSLAGVEVVGEAGDGHEAVRLAEELCPDVVLMDLSMPGLGGVEATTTRRTSPSVVLMPPPPQCCGRR